MTILQMSTESSVQVAFVLPIAQHLRKQGHHVVLACSDEPGEVGQSFVESLRQQGFDVQVLAILKTYQFLRQRRFGKLADDAVYIFDPRQWTFVGLSESP